MDLVTRVINVKNPSFRFSVVKAKRTTKNFFGKKTVTTHWCFVSEHMRTQTCVTEHGMMPYALFAKDKEAEFVFQWEVKNVTILWRVLHLFAFFGHIAHANNIRTICAGLTECSRGCPSDEECDTDETLMGFMASNAPLLQPPEMIMWDLALKDGNLIADKS